MKKLFHYLFFTQEKDVTKPRNGEPGTGNGEQDSGNERSAVFHIKIQNGGKLSG